MKVTIVTPYHKESHETLMRCVESVQKQTHEVRHILVGDGVAPFCDVETISLPTPHADFGDTPRFIGSVSAAAQGADAICWLDADNWITPDHVERLVEIAHRQVVDLVTATRNLRRPDGSLLGVCDESDGEAFCDTNCYLVGRRHFQLASLWGFKDRRMSAVGDRIVWAAAKQLPRAHCSHPTVEYTSTIAVHYLARGEQPPQEAKVIRQDGTGGFASYPYYRK